VPHLDDGALGNHTELRVKRRVGVLLHANDGQLEAGTHGPLSAHETRSGGRAVYVTHVVLSSGCVTCAFLKRRPIGRIKRSYLGGCVTTVHTERERERRGGGEEEQCQRDCSAPPPCVLLCF
jgi:hypothetical protein